MKDDFNQTVLLSQLSGMKFLSTFLMSFNKYKIERKNINSPLFYQFSVWKFQVELLLSLNSEVSNISIKLSLVENYFRVKMYSVKNLSIFFPKQHRKFLSLVHQEILCELSHDLISSIELYEPFPRQTKPIISKIFLDVETSLPLTFCLGPSSSC